MTRVLVALLLLALRLGPDVLAVDVLALRLALRLAPRPWRDVYVALGRRHAFHVDDVDDAMRGLPNASLRGAGRLSQRTTAFFKLNLVRWRKEEMLRKGCDSKTESWPLFAWPYFWYRHDTFF